MAIGPMYRAVLEVSEKAGVDIHHELAALQLTYAQILDPSTRLTPDQGRALMRRLVRASGDRELGLHAAERVELLDMDLVGYLTRHSANLLEASHLIARYDRLVGDSAEFRVEESAQHVKLHLGLSGGERWLQEGADFAAAAMYCLVKKLSNGRASPLRVYLPRPVPSRVRVYRSFFGASLEFNSEFPGLLYARAPLCVPFQESDPRLLYILRARAEDASTKLPSTNTWLARVRAEVSRSLEHGEHDLARIAKRCNVSVRTLRRHLDAAGTSYRAIVDGVRHERALQLMGRGERHVTTVARRLGYTDATAFARAFRRWTGLAPAQYLSRMLDPRADRPS